MLVKLVFFCNCDCESVEHVLWESPAYSNNRSVFINSLSKILCSDFHLTLYRPLTSFGVKMAARIFLTNWL